jgi:threonine efflux protein
MISTLLTIALLHWVALVTPGVNFLLLTQLAANGERESACYAALGISVVAGLWALSAVLGVNAVFAAHPQIRLVMQVAGGIYLCYLAFQFWRADASQANPMRVQLTPMAAFRLGVLTNIMNPKSVLFFGSVYATALPSVPGTPVLVAAVVLAFVNALS